MKLLLIQCRTDASAPHEYHCLINHGDLREDQFTIVNPMKNKNVLDNLDLSGQDLVIIGGSGEFGINHSTPEFDAVVSKMRHTLDDILQYQYPFLGMCLGHQLLAKHLGGEVVLDSKFEEVGSYKVELTPEGKKDPIFSDIADTFVAQHGHKESVIKLPKDAVHLSRGEKNEFGGFRYGPTAYGIQFHPELEIDDLMTRLELYPEYLGGKTVEEVKKGFKPSPQAPQVFRNFLEIAKDSKSVDAIKDNS